MPALHDAVDKMDFIKTKTLVESGTHVDVVKIVCILTNFAQELNFYVHGACY